MTINSIRRHICSHCGTIANGYFTYDGGWEFNCYCCSCVDKIPDSEIPPEIQRLRGRYSVNVLQSSNVFQGSGRPKFNDRSE